MLPSLSLRSAHQQYKVGTINTVVISSIIPPKEGIAIGIMTSDPLPVEVKMGSKANRVVAVVIMQGSTLRFPASRTACLISLTDLGFSSSNRWLSKLLRLLHRLLQYQKER